MMELCDDVCAGGGTPLIRRDRTLQCAHGFMCIHSVVPSSIFAVRNSGSVEQAGSGKPATECVNVNVVNVSPLARSWVLLALAN